MVGSPTFTLLLVDIQAILVVKIALPEILQRKKKEKKGGGGGEFRQNFPPDPLKN